MPHLTRSSHPAGALLRALAALALAASPAAAQQLVVDDAGIVEHGAFQLEGWISPSAAWLLPAFTPLPRTELTFGGGLVEEDADDSRTTEYVAQAKLQLFPDDPGQLGAAFVLGAGLGPFAQATGEQIDDFFAYVPLTYTLPDARAQWHVLGGWSYDREDEEHRALYGTRLDLLLLEPVSVIAELFGEARDLGYQAGFRVELVPDRLHLDASYGAAIRGDTPDIGGAIGIAWTPPPLFGSGAEKRASRRR